MKVSRRSWVIGFLLEDRPEDGDAKRLTAKRDDYEVGILLCCRYGVRKEKQQSTIPPAP